MCVSLGFALFFAHTPDDILKVYFASNIYFHIAIVFTLLSSFISLNNDRGCMLILYVGFHVSVSVIFL